MPSIVIVFTFLQRMYVAYCTYETENELKNVLHQLQGKVLLQPVLSSITIYLNQLVPFHLHLFSIQGERTKYWIFVKNFPGKRSLIFTGCEGTFSSEEFRMGFRQIIIRERVFERMKLEGYILSFGEKDIADEAYSILKEHGFYSPQIVPCYFFVKSDFENEPEMELPQGFTLDCLQMKDVPLVTRTWIHSHHDEEVYIRMRISSLPSVCVRNNMGNLAAFALTDEKGAIFHLFVFPQYRGKGFGMMIMKRIGWGINEKLGVIPYYCVVCSNEVMLRITNKKEQIQYPDGSPLLIHYRSIKYVGNQEELMK